MHAVCNSLTYYYIQPQNINVYNGLFIELYIISRK